ncbi:hypothetical protein KCP76_19445 [Salmonella enterica subsp. enterica serovar Weltevreden]|nr:hypothetical protein KCP76_19445 [Salmonella enterica subsp. enterica serovar Weltevreden]
MAHEVNGAQDGPYVSDTDHATGKLHKAKKFTQWALSLAGILHLRGSHMEFFYVVKATQKSGSKMRRSGSLHENPEARAALCWMSFLEDAEVKPAAVGDYIRRPITRNTGSQRAAAGR